MLSSNNPELDPDDLAEKIKAVSANRRRSEPLFGSDPSTPPAEAAAEPSARVSGVRATIKRIPVIGRIAVAANRRLCRIRAPGLGRKQRLKLVPVIGPLLAWAYTIVRINRVREDINCHLADIRQIHHAYHADLNQRLFYYDCLNIEARLHMMEIDGRARAQWIDKVESRLRNLEAGLQPPALKKRLERTEQDLQSSLAQIRQLEAQVAGLRQLLHRHAAATEDGFQPAPSLPVAAPAADSRAAHPSRSLDLDTFYAEFEDRFRGPREDIRERLKVYLPYLENLAGDASARVVDIGCGRGEWLGLMKDAGINAIGVDLNEAMVRECRGYGYAAEYGDAIAYLRQLPEASIAAVTGIHVIEHLPFELLIDLFDAALHALRPDGIVIFETPNPENVMVGACSFYLDPTHLHPIVPAVAEFTAYQRGYSRAEILRLHPYPDHARVAEETEVARRFNSAFYGPQDYAVIAWKTCAS